MNIAQWMGRSAVVTGAGSGFGEKIARVLAAAGMKLVVTDVNLQPVQNLADSLKANNAAGEILPMKCDVTNEAEVKTLYQTVREKYGGVDVSVQCAGLSRAAPLLSGDANEWRLMQETNVLGVLYCCREAINLMRENNVDDGVLINLVSLAAYKWTGFSDMHFYGATKVMLMAVQEGIRQELREMNSNIRISGISPGQGNTNFYPDMYNKGSDIGIPMLKQQLEATDIADVVKYILSTPKYVQVHDVLLRPVTQP